MLGNVSNKVCLDSGAWEVARRMLQIIVDVIEISNKALAVDVLSFRPREDPNFLEVSSTVSIKAFWGWRRNWKRSVCLIRILRMNRCG